MALSKIKSKWELFQIDTNLLPDGDIVIKTKDGFIHTNKITIKEAKDMAIRFTEELKKENKDGT